MSLDNFLSNKVFAAIAGNAGAGNETTAVSSGELRQLLQELADAAPKIGLKPDATSPTTVNRVADFQSAMAQLVNGGSLLIKTGTYFFNITGDSDTILIPSNVKIECEPGVIFRWGYWGSPLFAIVNKINVKLLLREAKFVWTGTFGTTSGNADKFGFGKAIPAYEWCAHIAIVGSEYSLIEDFRCEGDTTANQLNNGLEVRGKNDGSLTLGNQFRRLKFNDVCQGMFLSEQDDFVIEKVTSDRYSNASNALYGPGHVLYVGIGATVSQHGTISDCVDKGTALSAYVSGSVSYQIRTLKHSKIKGLLSQRDEGVLSYSDLEDVEIDCTHYTAVSTVDTNGASIIGIQPSTPNKAVKLRATIVQDVQRNMAPVSMGQITVGTNNLDCDAEFTIVRTMDGTETVPSVIWVGNRGKCKIKYTNKGSGTAKVVCDIKSASDDCNIYIDASGSVPNPRITVTSGTNITFWNNGDAAIDSDPNEFTPANGNSIIWQSRRGYQSSQTYAAGANPTGTFTLPKPGAYLVDINVISADKNQARSVLYWIVFDDAATNDYTSATLIGTTAKGTTITVLALAVNNVGVCTMTSTATSDTWTMKYGYQELRTA